MTAVDARRELVTIGVLTFQRPDDLAAVLPLLIEQAEDLQRPDRAVEILVVDNDAEGGGLPVVEALGSDRVRYAVEPTPGIAAARNRVLDEAAESRFLIFIDDDERPHQGWLRSLLDLQQHTAAVAVAGAVVSDFAHEPEPWIGAGDFFRRRRLATGTEIDVAATNNLLLDMSAVRAAGLRFDAAFGLTGGSDTLFTRQLGATGPMVWCDEAVVTDHVPASRLTRRWVLRRAFRSGNSASRVELAMAAGTAARLSARLRGLGRGMPRLGGGLARWVVGQLVRSAAHQARGLRTAARGAGMVSGAVGIVYSEYRRGAAS
jgi:glycosyltransferase involved in cell wall biosynthesis